MDVLSRSIVIGPHGFSFGRLRWDVVLKYQPGAKGEDVEKLLQFIDQIQSDKRFGDLDEAAVKQGIVLKLLSLLEWDPFNIYEIQPAFLVGNARMDFCMKNGERSEVFLEVRKEESRVKEHEQELLANADAGKVGLAVLTDGMIWRFYLLQADGDEKEKKFHTIDVKKQKPELVVKSLELFLSKKNILSGKALKTAENMINTRRRESLLHQHLPKAWHTIMSEPEKWLVNILREATKDLCGYTPDRETAERFIKSKRDGRVEAIESWPTVQGGKGQRDGGLQTYNDRQISSFKLDKREYKVKSWQEMLLRFCELIYEKHKDDFEMVLTLANQEKEYFSEIQYKFLNSEQIPGTTMYVDMDLSPDEMVRICHEMLPLFGYRDGGFSIGIK
jgi:predicted type IV restriction endonuclease